MLEIHLDPYFTPYTNLNSKWIIDLNRKTKTIKILEENMKENLPKIGRQRFLRVKKH